MADEKTISYEILVKGTDESIIKLEALKKQQVDVTKALKDHMDAVKSDADRTKNFIDIQNQLELTLKGLNKEIATTTKVVLDKNKVLTEEAGSYNQLSAQLAIVSERWKRMSAEMRDNSAAGKALTKERDDLQAKLYSLDQMVGVHTRNVGNYASGLKGLNEVGIALARTFGVNEDVIRGLTEAHGVLRYGIMGTKQVIEGFGVAQKDATVATEAGTVAMKAQEAATPVGWIALALTALASLAFATWAYVTAAKKQEEVQGNLKRLEEDSFAAEMEHHKKQRENSDDEIKNNLQKLVDEGKLTEAGAKRRYLNDVAAGDRAKIDVKETLANNKLIEQANKLKYSEDTLIEFKLAINKKYSDERDDLEKKLQTDITKINQEETKKRTDEFIAAKEAQFDYLAGNADKVKKQIGENNKEIERKAKELWNYQLKFLDKNISDATSLYKEDTDNFIKEAERKDQSAREFWDKILMDAVKLSGSELDIEQARYIQEFDILKTQLHNEKITQIQYDAAAEIMEATHKKKISDIDKKAGEEQGEQQKKNNEKILNAAEENVKRIEQAIFDAQNKALVRANKVRNDAIDAQNKTELDKIDDRSKKGLITQAQADALRKQQEIKFKADKLASDKKAFEDEKKLKIKQIEIDAAVSIAKIWLGMLAAYAGIPVAGPALSAAGAGIESAIVAATAAVQIGIISSQKFARGGRVLKGNSHAMGGIPVEAEGDEIIMTKGVYRDPYLRSMASMVNQAGGGIGFASGGVPLPTGTSNPLSNIAGMGLDMDSFANRIISGINNKKVFIVEKEMTGAQNKAAIVENANRF